MTPHDIDIVILVQNEKRKWSYEWFFIRYLVIAWFFVLEAMILLKYHKSFKLIIWSLKSFDDCVES